MRNLAILLFGTALSLLVVAIAVRLKAIVTRPHPESPEDSSDKWWIVGFFVVGIGLLAGFAELGWDLANGSDPAHDPISWFLGLIAIVGGAVLAGMKDHADKHPEEFQPEGEQPSEKQTESETEQV